MAHTITIPDVGDIDFPDSMSDADIAAAAKRLHATAQVEKTGPVSRFVSNAAEGANPVSILSGMGESMLHPLQAIRGYLKQNSDLADKVEAAIKRGDHGQALKHFGDLALQVIPGLGATSDAAGEQIAQGDVAGGLGKSAGAALGVVEASALPKVARGTAEVIHAAPSVAGAAIRAGGADVAGGAAKAGVGAAVQALPIPHELKLGAGFELGRRGAAQIAKGVKEGYKAGAEVVKNRNVIPPSTPQPEVVPSEEPWRPFTPQPMEQVVPQATPEMLQQAGVPFTAEEQALADHVLTGTEPQPPAAGYENIPLQGPAEGNVIPIQPQGEPVQPGISLPGGQGAAVGPEVPGLDAQRALAQELTGSTEGGQIPAPASAHPPAEAFEGAYRAKRAQVLADHFHQNGLSYEDVGHLTPEDLTSEQWEALLGKDPATGAQFRKPSQKTIDQARVFLAGKSAAGANPKALAAAQGLSAEIGPQGSDVVQKSASAVETPYQKKIGDLGMKIRDHQPVTDADFEGLTPEHEAAFRRLQKEYSRKPTEVKPFEPTVTKKGSSGAEEVSGKFDSSVGDDDYLYHVTTKANAAKILREGVQPGKPQAMSEGFWRDYSKGKAFLAERSGVSYWQEKIANHLENQFDNPPELAVIRVPKSSVKGLKVDELGAKDSGRGSYYVEPAALAETPKPKPRAKRTTIGAEMKKTGKE